ncbi:MAG: hypothetical protein GQF41_3089 [Candidatus Rifleibacterium amylolyticum]|nr:MAG: hypothetical protein GQF41_3089 [Candidatus Rifleibacterium amylolyticum]
MNKTELIAILSLLTVLVSGCSLEYASDIKEENIVLQTEIDKLKMTLAEVPTVHNDIERLKHQLSQRTEELHEFQQKYPEVVKYARENEKE